MLIKRYALFEGHEVTQASDGLEAVRLCEKNAFDIIIMGVMVPKLDGFSAVRQIRERSDVPEIILSARGKEYDRIFGFEPRVDEALFL